MLGGGKVDVFAEVVDVVRLCYSSFIPPIKPTSLYSSTTFPSSGSHHLGDYCPSTCCFPLRLDYGKLLRMLWVRSACRPIVSLSLTWHIRPASLFPTAAGYARYELNQLVYSLILILILISILYSTSTTPNRFSFSFLNLSVVPFIV